MVEEPAGSEQFSALCSGTSLPAVVLSMCLQRMRERVRSSNTSVDGSIPGDHTLPRLRSASHGVYTHMQTPCDDCAVVLWLSALFRVWPSASIRESIGSCKFEAVKVAIMILE